MRSTSNSEIIILYVDGRLFGSIPGAVRSYDSIVDEEEEVCIRLCMNQMVAAWAALLQHSICHFSFSVVCYQCRIQTHARLIACTLHSNEPHPISNTQDPTKQKLGKVIAYRHWTNCTDEWKYTPPSYMMARRLVKRFVYICMCV